MGCAAVDALLAALVSPSDPEPAPTDLPRAAHLGWLAQSLAQPRLAPVAEAWRHSLPWVIEDCIANGGVGAAAGVRSLLHAASTHTSPVLRRLGLGSALEFERRARGPPLVAAVCVASAAVSALSVGCEAGSGTSGSDDATRRPSHTLELPLHDDAALVSAAARLLVELELPPLTTLRVVLGAALHGGSLLLAAAERCVGSSQEQPLPVAAALASARARRTGLAAVSPAVGALVAAVATGIRGRDGPADAGDAAAAAEEAAGVLSDARLLCARLPPAAEAIASSKCAAAPASSARFVAARAVARLVLSTMAPLPAQAFGSPEFARVFAGAAALPLSPDPALATACCTGQGLQVGRATSRGAAARRRGENGAWLQEVAAEAASWGAPRRAALALAVERAAQDHATGAGAACAALLIAGVDGEGGAQRPLGLPLATTVELLLCALQLRATACDVGGAASCGGPDPDGLDAGVRRVAAATCAGVEALLRTPLPAEADGDVLGAAAATWEHVAGFLCALSAWELTVPRGCDASSLAEGLAGRLLQVHGDALLQRAPSDVAAGVALRCALDVAGDATAGPWLQARVEALGAPSAQPAWCPVALLPLLGALPGAAAAVLQAVAGADVGAASGDTALAHTAAVGGSLTAPLRDPLRHLCDAVAAAATVAATASAGVDPTGLVAPACATLHRIVAALPSGAPRAAGVATLSGALFHPRVWGARSFGGSVCATTAILGDAAGRLLEELVAPAAGVDAPGCDACIVAFARPALAVLPAAAAAGSECARALLLRLTAAGEAVWAAPSSSSPGGATSDEESAAVVRAHAAAALASCAVAEGSGSVALAVASAAVAPAGMLRAAKPRSSLLVRQMRAWQAAAAVALLGFADATRDSLPAHSEGWARQVGEALARACNAPLVGPVRQYVELAVGAHLALAEAAGHSAVGTLAAGLLSSLTTGTIPPSCSEEPASGGDGRALDVPALPGVRLGWSNVVLLSTAAVVAMELGERHPHACASWELGVAGLVDALVVACACTQRRGVREALQCLLRRLAPLWARLPPASRSPVAGAALAALASDPEAARMAASQPTLLQEPAGALLAATQAQELLALVYAALPVDDHIPVSERAHLLPVMGGLAGGPLAAAATTVVVGGSDTPRLRALMARVNAREAAVAAERQAAAASLAGAEGGSGNGDGGGGDGEDEDPRNALHGAQALHKAQGALRHLRAALAQGVAGAAPPPVLFHAKAPTLAPLRGLAAPPPLDGRAAHLPHPHVTLVASLVSKPGNVGSILRAAEALGSPGRVTVALGSAPAALLAHPEVVRMAAGAGGRLAAAGALKLLAPRSLPGFLAAAVAEPARGSGRRRARVVALELTPASVPLPRWRLLPSPPPAGSGGEEGAAWPPEEDVILVLGHEVDGVPAGVLAAAGACVAVPQLGATASLNVATAAALALYEIAAQAASGGARI